MAGMALQTPHVLLKLNNLSKYPSAGISMKVNIQVRGNWRDLLIFLLQLWSCEGQHIRLYKPSKGEPPADARQLKTNSLGSTQVQLRTRLRAHGMSRRRRRDVSQAQQKRRLSKPRTSGAAQEKAGQAKDATASTLESVKGRSYNAVLCVLGMVPRRRQARQLKMWNKTIRLMLILTLVSHGIVLGIATLTALVLWS